MKADTVRDANASVSVFDPNIVCPETGQDLFAADDALVTPDGQRRYRIDEDVPDLFVDGESGQIKVSNAGESSVTTKVRDFYDEAPFPNYNDMDNIGELVRRARRSVFARLLGEQIPEGSNVLEVGCGTGQLSNYLAAVCMARVYATDMTPASLRLASAFARDNRLAGIRILRMNLFWPCIRPSSMDLVISTGVLHHTADTRRAFLSIAPLVKPGGHIIVGLYNKIGRLRTDLRRFLYRRFGQAALLLDPQLRGGLSPDKWRAWIRDQYCHPRESKHSLDEVLSWFDEAGFTFVSSIPKIMGRFSGDEELFHCQPVGGKSDRLYAQLEMLLSHFGGEGGLFIMIGRRGG
jgi:2-polyprenyl-3-methyl-5-hydroxy-6-metoxy-1,4-benzoquinol methylase